jgi:Protein of unknown function (DUF3592)
MLKLRSLLRAARRGCVFLTTAFAFAMPAQAQTGAGSGPPLWVILLIGAVFLAVAGLIGYIMVRQVRSARASRSWPIAPGTVLSGTVETVTERDSDGTSTYFTPRLRYAYEVSGRRYESERIRFGQIRESERGARKVLERYPAGSPVEVRYDPANPADATLEAKAGGIGLMLFALAAIAAVFLYLVSVFLG